jgi:hypothetical protein
MVSMLNPFLTRLMMIVRAPAFDVDHALSALLLAGKQTFWL